MFIFGVRKVTASLHSAWYEWDQNTIGEESFRLNSHFTLKDGSSACCVLFVLRRKMITCLVSTVDGSRLVSGIVCVELQ